jgi:hypothetical protein
MSQLRDVMVELILFANENENASRRLEFEPKSGHTA